MRYLYKSHDSPIIASGWQYSEDADKVKIRATLRKEQYGFCAYSEEWIKEAHSTDIEHFDPRLKKTDEDGYWNWYAVQPGMNRRKDNEIEKYEPILTPYSPDIAQRITYEDRQFQPIDPADKEASNLIRLLGWNKPELERDRRNHIKRIRSIYPFF